MAALDNPGHSTDRTELKTPMFSKRIKTCVESRAQHRHETYLEWPHVTPLFPSAPPKNKEGVKRMLQTKLFFFSQLFGDKLWLVQHYFYCTLITIIKVTYCDCDWYTIKEVLGTKNMLQGEEENGLGVKVVCWFSKQLSFIKNIRPKKNLYILRKWGIVFLSFPLRQGQRKEEICHSTKYSCTDWSWSQLQRDLQKLTEEFHI